MNKIRKLTVAVPVFNMAPYLEETLICIENQTIGMENMEVILINDGSTDASDRICRSFQKKHVENVRYVELPENRGVSHAKNTALDMAGGACITFWDADDLWSLNAMEEAVTFLDAHKEEIDMVSSNIEYFESSSRPHVLNFNVTRNAIIDIQKDYEKIRTVGPACVMRTESARQYRFDEFQARWEDARYMNQLLLRKRNYGMLANVQFYYRRRKSNNSATQSHSKDKRCYLYDLKSFFDGIYEESLKQCGEFLPMMQYLTAYTLGYYFAETAEILTAEEKRQYEEICRNILSHIEDRYLREIPNADMMVKWKLLAARHRLGIEQEIEQWQEEKGRQQWNEVRLARITMNHNVMKRWFVLKCQGKMLSPYFEKNGYQRVAVYGLSDLGMYLLEELKGTSVDVVYGIDKRAKRLKAELPVLTPEEMLPEVDVIIVTAVYFFSEIDMLLRGRVSCPVISLEDVLYTIE